MKFSVAIILLVIGLAQCEDKIPSIIKKGIEEGLMMDVPEGLNHTQCIFKKEEKIVSCRRNVETVECEAECDTTLLGKGEHVPKSNVYGIGMSVDKTEKRIESIRYFAYPRKADNITYLEHSAVGESGRRVELAVGCGEKAIDYAGLRIKDCKCFEKIVKIFEESSRVPHMAKLETEPTIVQEVPLIGEILVLDKAMQKRWLFGLGLGFPFMGLGLGWGFPLFG